MTKWSYNIVPSLFLLESYFGGKKTKILQNYKPTEIFQSFICEIERIFINFPTFYVTYL